MGFNFHSVGSFVSFCQPFETQSNLSSPINGKQSLDFNFPNLAMEQQFSNILAYLDSLTALSSVTSLLQFKHTVEVIALGSAAELIPLPTFEILKLSQS